MKNESPFPASAGWILWLAILLERCSGRRRHPAALPDLIYTPPKERMLQRKLIDGAVLAGARNVAGNQYTNWLLQWPIMLKEWSRKKNRALLLRGRKTSAPECLAYKILYSDTECLQLSQ